MPASAAFRLSEGNVPGRLGDARVQGFDHSDRDQAARDLRPVIGGADEGAIPAKVLENMRPIVMSGLAKLVKLVNQ